ncbi:MAG: hypothetical protein Q4D58_11450 [Synergistaceae bacterium]|nr:hypothetical protein [Synergistaceae bacterium]
MRQKKDIFSFAAPLLLLLLLLVSFPGNGDCMDKPARAVFGCERTESSSSTESLLQSDSPAMLSAANLSALQTGRRIARAGFSLCDLSCLSAEPRQYHGGFCRHVIPANNFSFEERYINSVKKLE